MGLFTMGLHVLSEYWVPEHVRDFLRRMGFCPAAGRHGALDPLLERLDVGKREPLRL